MAKSDSVTVPLKIPKGIIKMLKRMNNTLLDDEFDNILALTAVAVTDFYRHKFRKMKRDDFYAFVVSMVYDLQNKGIIKDNARSIPKK